MISKKTFMLFVLLAISMASVSATWYSTNYQNKATFTVFNNNSYPLINYSVYANITYQAKMNSNFSDLIFVNNSDNALVPFWIENTSVNNYAMVWIKIPYIPANSNIAYYYYFNNATPVSALSNFSQAFIFGDDYSSDTSANYNLLQQAGTCSFTITGGIFSVISGTTGGSTCIAYPKIQYQLLSQNYTIEALRRYHQTGSSYGDILGYWNAIPSTQPHQANASYLNFNGASGGWSFGINAGDISSGFLTGSYNVFIYQNLTLYTPNANTIVNFSYVNPNNTITSGGYIGTAINNGYYGMSDYSGAGNGINEFEWFRVRPFASIVPSYQISNQTALPSSYTINSQSYNPTTSSGSIESFNINFTYNSSAYSGIAVAFNYNNTNYTTQQTGTGDTVLFTSTINIPNVNSQINNTFYWILSFSNSTGVTTYTTSSLQQVINPFLADNCSAYTKPLFNFTIYDEESLAKMNGTINLLINFYTLGTTNLVGTYNNSFNYITTGSSAVCLNNLSNGYTIGYQIQYYGNASYYKRYKVIQSMTISNSTLAQNISLYDLLTSSGTPFKVIVVGSSLTQQNSGLLVQAQRQYLNLNTYTPVEDTITDSNGYGILNLVPNSVVYNFVVSYNGQIIATFNNMKVQCQNAATGACAITLNLAQITGVVPNYQYYGNVSTSYLFNNNSQTLYLTFSSTDGNSHTLNQIVAEDDGYGNTTICNYTTSGTSGTISCVIPVLYQNTNIWSSLDVDGNFVENKYFSLAPPINFYGVDVLIELLMVSCLVMLFIHHPVFIVIGTVLGVACSLLLIFMSTGNFGTYVGIISYLVAVSGIVIWQISRKI